MSDSYATLLYEKPAPGVARIVMNRPDARNAQNLDMTYDLDAAFSRAVADDEVKAIILAGADPHFSAGHDLRDTNEKKLGEDRIHPVVIMVLPFEPFRIFLSRESLLRQHERTLAVGLEDAALGADPEGA